jgi:hypothetical protein
MNLFDAYNRGGLQTAGAGLDISGQTPTAAPSLSAGIGTFILTLRTAGFPVTHD